MYSSIKSLRDKLSKGDSVFGSFIFSRDPGICEAYGDAGFDFVIIDLEHAMNDVGTVVNHIRACEARNISALVRIGGHMAGDIPRLLDAGASGIMLPHVGVKGDSIAADPRVMRYPPHGLRPTCTGIRAVSYGLSNFAQYVQESNAAVFSIGLVEDREVVESMDAVLDELPLDCVMPGPGDLASSYGVHGNLTHPTVQAAVDKVIAAAVKRGATPAMYVNRPEEIPAWHAKGARLFVYSIDSKILARTLADAISACRSEVKANQG